MHPPALGVVPDVRVCAPWSWTTACRPSSSIITSSLVPPCQTSPWPALLDRARESTYRPSPAPRSVRIEVAASAEIRSSHPPAWPSLEAASIYQRQRGVAVTVGVGDIHVAAHVGVPPRRRRAGRHSGARRSLPDLILLTPQMKRRRPPWSLTARRQYQSCSIAFTSQPPVNRTSIRSAGSFSGCPRRAAWTGRQQGLDGTGAATKERMAGWRSLRPR